MAAHLPSGVYPLAPIALAEAPRPGLARTNPSKKQRRESLAPFFARWCRDKNISVRDLQALFGCTIAVAQEMLTGRKPIHWEDLFALPHRYRHELYFAAEAEMSGAASPTHVPARAAHR